MKQSWKYSTREIRIDGDLAYIPLQNGEEAIIDADCVDLVRGWNWWAQPNKEGRTVGIRRANTGGLQIILSRLIIGASASAVVDHKNGNVLDNRRGNLRSVTRAENKINSKVRSDCLSGYKGVSRRSSGKFRARIMVEGRRIFLGEYTNAALAAKAYDVAARRFFGDIACLNFPHDGERGARE